MATQKLKEKIEITIIMVIMAIILWIPICTVIQRFKCPAMTETQLFLHIPSSFMCNWKNCN